MSLRTHDAQTDAAALADDDALMGAQDDAASKKMLDETIQKLGVEVLILPTVNFVDPVRGTSPFRDGPRILRQVKSWDAAIDAKADALTKVRCHCIRTAHALHTYCSLHMRCTCLRAAHAHAHAHAHVHAHAHAQLFVGARAGLLLNFFLFPLARWLQFSPLPPCLPRADCAVLAAPQPTALASCG